MYPLLFLLIGTVYSQQTCYSDADCSYCNGQCGGTGSFACGSGFGVVCNNCYVRGQYADYRCARNCINTCPAGTYRPDCYTCEPCTPGSYCTGTVSTTPCPAGSFMPNSGASECIYCATASIGQTVCNDCRPGTYKVTNNNTVNCIECPLNTYSSAYGSSSCTACAQNLFTMWIGQASCIGCEAGQYLA